MKITKSIILTSIYLLLLTVNTSISRKVKAKNPTENVNTNTSSNSNANANIPNQQALNPIQNSIPENITKSKLEGVNEVKAIYKSNYDIECIISSYNSMTEAKVSTKFYNKKDEANKSSYKEGVLLSFPTEKETETKRDGLYFIEYKKSPSPSEAIGDTKIPYDCVQCTFEFIKYESLKADACFSAKKKRSTNK